MGGTHRWGEPSPWEEDHPNPLSKGRMRSLNLLKLGWVKIFRKKNLGVAKKKGSSSKDFLYSNQKDNLNYKNEVRPLNFYSAELLASCLKTIVFITSTFLSNLHVILCFYQIFMLFLYIYTIVYIDRVSRFPDY